MLSMKAKYALKALIVMGQHENKMLSSKTMSQLSDAPPKFLDTILQDLRHHGIIDSKRGIFGGYFLAKPASTIKIGDIVRLIDGMLAPVSCASVTLYKKCDDCHEESTCKIRHVMVQVRNAISGVLDNLSLHDLSITEVNSL
jgi:Rrf2 family protein